MPPRTISRMTSVELHLTHARVDTGRRQQLLDDMRLLLRGVRRAAIVAFAEIPTARTERLLRQRVVLRAASTSSSSRNSGVVANPAIADRRGHQGQIELAVEQRRSSGRDVASTSILHLHSTGTSGRTPGAPPAQPVVDTCSTRSRHEAGPDGRAPSARAHLHRSRIQRAASILPPGMCLRAGLEHTLARPASRGHPPALRFGRAGRATVPSAILDVRAAGRLASRRLRRQRRSVIGRRGQAAVRGDRLAPRRRWRSCEIHANAPAGAEAPASSVRRSVREAPAYVPVGRSPSLRHGTVHAALV